MQEGQGGPRSSTASFEARHTAAGVGKRAKCWDYITQGEKDKTTTTENDIKAKVFCMPLSSDVLSYISFFFNFKNKLNVHPVKERAPGNGRKTQRKSMLKISNKVVRESGIPLLIVKSVPTLNKKWQKELIFSTLQTGKERHTNTCVTVCFLNYTFESHMFMASFWYSFLKEQGKENSLVNMH